MRAVEIVYACDEALRLIADYEPPDAPSVPIEAARRHRLCLHRGAARHALPPLRLDDDGSILEARIVPPTSQNQVSIEEDLCRVATDSLELSDEALRHRCEQTIRNHDPCISCSCHFLKLSVHRE